MNTNKYLCLLSALAGLTLSHSASFADGHAAEGAIDSGPIAHTSLREFDACLPLPDGRVLAGSAGGLVVIDKDGKHQASYTALDGLPGTRIHSLEAAPGGVWVGTDRGAARIRLSSVASVGARPALVIVDAFRSKPVRDILIDGNSVVAATWGQGLVRYKNSVIKAIHKGDSMPASRVTSIAKIDGEYWWTTAGAGLWRKGKGLAQRTPAFPENALLWSIEGKTSASALVGGQSGVFSMSGQSKSGNLYSVRAIDVGKSSVEVASFGGGLRTIRGHKATEAPSEAFVRSLRTAHGTSCMGSQNALWIRRGSTKKWAQVELKSSLPGNDIAAFVSNGTESYVGTFDHGVAKLVNGRFEAIGTKHDPHVNALALDKVDGALWIATSSELVRIHKGRVSRFSKHNGLPSRHVMSLFALKSGGVLVGTAHGAATVKDGFATTLGGKVGIRTGNVWAVAQSDNGDNWLGTTRGLFRIRSGRISRYRVISGELKDDWVMALAPASDGIFVGTYKAGVVRLQIAGDEVTTTQLGEGWINPGGLHWDGKRLRAATMYGAFEGNGVTPQWQREKNVLGVDTTVFVPSAGGQEWIVTRNGLSRQRR